MLHGCNVRAAGQEFLSQLLHQHGFLALAAHGNFNALHVGREMLWSVFQEKALISDTLRIAQSPFLPGNSRLAAFLQPDLS